MTIPSDTIRIENSKVLWSCQEKHRKGRPLLILMHGYASNEQDLHSLSPLLPQVPVIASLRAPLNAHQGYAWFSLNDGEQGLELRTIAEEPVARAVEAVLTWIKTLPWTPPSISLLGFSQGGTMVLELMREAPHLFASGVQLSGCLARTTTPGDRELATRKPPVFFGRGSEDTVIPAESTAATSKWLRTHSTMTERVYTGMAHAISQNELADICSFLGAHYWSHRKNGPLPRLGE